MNNKLRMSAIACQLGGAAVFLAPMHADAAAPYLCTSSHFPVEGSTVAGNLEVQSGAVCILDAVTVKGSVLADSDSSLTLEGGTLIKGNLIADTTQVWVTDSTIEGSQTQFNGSSGEQSCAGPMMVPSVCGSTFDGSVTISGYYTSVYMAGFVFGAPEFCPGNTVLGNLSAFNNNVEVDVEDNSIRGTVTAHQNFLAVIEANAIRGGLNCSANTSVEGTGTNNVRGTETGQCKGF